MKEKGLEERNNSAIHLKLGPPMKPQAHLKTENYEMKKRHSTRVYTEFVPKDHSTSLNHQRQVKILCTVRWPQCLSWINDILAFSRRRTFFRHKTCPNLKSGTIDDSIRIYLGVKGIKKNVPLTDLLRDTRKVLTKFVRNGPSVAQEFWAIDFIAASFAANLSCISTTCARVQSNNSSSRVLSAVAHASSPFKSSIVASRKAMFSTKSLIDVFNSATCANYLLCADSVYRAWRNSAVAFAIWKKNPSKRQ